MLVGSIVGFRGVKKLGALGDLPPNAMSPSAVETK
jgi:hypothetical protein